MYRIKFHAHYWAEGPERETILETFVGNDKDCAIFISDSVKMLLDAGFEDVEVECRKVML